MIAIELVPLPPELIGLDFQFKQHAEWDTSGDTKSISTCFCPSFFEGLGRIEGLIRTLVDFSFGGEIVVSITPEGCSVTGDVKTTVENLKELIVPILNQIEARGMEISNMVRGVPYQLTWVFKQITKPEQQDS